MRTKKILILAAAVCLGAYGAYMVSVKAEEYKTARDLPVWLETDSAAAIDRRIAADFTLSRHELLETLQRAHPEVTDADIDSFLCHKYIEAVTIDGEQRFHRKSPRNLNLLNPAYNGGARRRGDKASPARISYVDSVLSFYRGNNSRGLSHEVTYRFTIEVPGQDIFSGDTLRVWMPVPMATDRQRDIEILSATPSAYVLSDGRSIHNSIYFEAPAPAPGDTAHFEYTGRFITSGKYATEADILANIKPYDTASAEYRKYTAAEAPHIIRLDSLAHAIVGNETNPYRQSEMVFEYIIDRYPWAGAREYSTIACIPQYVVDEGHGDCGQVSLLYISLMRSLGVPARWESGWMLHPGEVNLHDWAEVYFEGVGWLPVDVSFGRYTGSDDAENTGFYSHGIDAHRLAANKGVGGDFYPAKRFVRSETVDFQVGEVECSKGNVFYPAWSYNLEIINKIPIESEP